MRTAIISDLHANLAASTAVFRHIESLGDVNRIICLGDAVGYGPNPVEVLNLVMEHAEFCLLGNHEEAILKGAVNFNPKAKLAIDWTKTQVTENPKDSEESNRKRLEYLQAMKEHLEEDKFLFVHGSPRQPTREYLMPRDAFDRRKMKDIFDHMGKYQIGFTGHTHQPGVFTYEGYFHHSEMYDVYLFGDGEKAVINVGSVGQPRDGDPKSCYVTLCEDSVVWHRVPYDINETKQLVYEIPELDNFFGDRLLEGR